MERAYSVLHVKDIDEEKRVIRGMATTPATDRVGDRVEPLGVKVAADIPLFLYHDSRLTVGRARFGKATEEGIPFEATIPQVKEAGRLQERVDEAWQMLKYRLITAVSIGFNVLENGYEIMKNGGYRYLKTEVLELSLVPIPANADATITSIKSLDTAMLAAQSHGQGGAVRLGASPGASGQQSAAVHRGFQLKPTAQKGTDMNIAEQLKALRDARATKAARMGAIMTKAADEGRTTDADEEKEFDELQADIAKADSDITRLETLERMNKSSAVAAGTERQQPGNVRGEGSVEISKHFTVRRNLEKGTAFTRYAMALLRTKGSIGEALNMATAMTSKGGAWSDTPEVELALKAASAAGSTTDSTFASSLVYAQDLQSEFIDLLRPLTILGKFGMNGIPALRRVPFNVRMASQTGGGTYGWVGEGAPKPVGELTITDVTLRWAKAAGIIVITDELAKFSGPSAEAVVRRDMLAGMASFSDLQFISPQVFAVTNVSPASVTNLVTDVPATGTTADAFRTDIATLLGRMWTANLAPTSGVWVMSNRRATTISLMRNALGNKEFPDMTPMGGMLEGFPVIASESVPDTSDGGMIVFINADDIFFSDDGPVAIDVSREATLQMDTAPTDPTVAATVLISLWQRNLIGLRAERYMNWQKRRSAAVQYISGANYA